MRAWLARMQPERVAQISGLIFIPAGLVKFAFHAWELRAFRDFGIPAASIMEPIVGGLEVLGGVLLLKRILIAPTAFVLAVIMLVAFVMGGVVHGSPIPSDTLAPALLAAMIYLMFHPASRSTLPRWRRSAWVKDASRPEIDPDGMTNGSG
jgi:uncharacterized membrane protein YphA (DoxX/SURF4 family)